MQPTPFREAAQNYFEKNKTVYPKQRALVLQLLNLAQEKEGSVSEEAMGVIGELLGMTVTDVMGVASFYTLLDRKERGEHLVQVCDNITCGILSSFKAAEYLSEKLGVPLGGTTPDKKFTLRGVECLADCGRAPCMMVDQEQLGCVTPEKINEVLDRYARD